MSPKLTFSDDKLRIFKNVMLSQTAPIYVSHSELEALLNRLEKAENGLIMAYNQLDRRLKRVGVYNIAEGNFLDACVEWDKSKGEAR